MKLNNNMLNKYNLKYINIRKFKLWYIYNLAIN